MDLKELIDLIAIRQYVVNATANPAIDRATITYMSDLLLLTDKKIIGLLMSNEFKEYVEYKNYRQLREDAARITNIRSGLKKT